jgi:hypothetical protein
MCGMTVHFDTQVDIVDCFEETTDILDILGSRHEGSTDVNHLMRKSESVSQQMMTASQTSQALK